MTYVFPEERRPEMKSDVLALGFITDQEDAVILRVDSGTSNDYMELEIVSNKVGISKFTFQWRLVVSKDVCSKIKTSINQHTFFNNKLRRTQFNIFHCAFTNLNKYLNQLNTKI